MIERVALALCVCAASLWAAVAAADEPAASSAAAVDARAVPWQAWLGAEDAAAEALRESLEARWYMGMREAGVSRPIAMLSGRTLMLGSSGDDEERAVTLGAERGLEPKMLAVGLDEVAVLYVGDGTTPGQLVGVSAGTGKRRWGVQIGAAGAARVTAWQDSFVVTSRVGGVRLIQLFDAGSGALVWQARLKR